MDTNIQNSGTVEITSPNNHEIYVNFPTDIITCFFYDKLEFLAVPNSGYKFVKWDFSIWPKDYYSKNISDSSNPMYFFNTASDYPTLDDYRLITAYFEGIISQPPKNLKATDGSEINKIIITWESSEFADKYKLFRSNSIQGEKIKIIETNNLVFNDTDLINGDIYYYWVTSINTFGESQFSEYDTGSSYKEIPIPIEIDKDGDGFMVSDGDCNDLNKNIYPGALEICGNGVDEDCNGIDLKCEPIKIDKDGDGYFVGYGDCNDNDSTIHINAIEICGDGIDQDCSGNDLPCVVILNDIDKDGYTINNGDCDDNNSAVFPGALEICGNGVDEDCDGEDLKCKKQDDGGCFISAITR